jgi:hypothetical protein
MARRRATPQVTARPVRNSRSRRTPRLRPLFAAARLDAGAGRGDRDAANEPGFEHRIEGHGATGRGATTWRSGGGGLHRSTRITWRAAGLGASCALSYGEGGKPTTATKKRAASTAAPRSSCANALTFRAPKEQGTGTTKMRFINAYLISYFILVQGAVPSGMEELFSTFPQHGWSSDSGSLSVWASCCRCRQVSRNHQ